MRRSMRVRTSVALGVAVLVSGCARSVPVIEVTGRDYALTAPDSAAPGLTRVHFVSNGTVAHEVAIARIKNGVRLDSLLALEFKGADVEGMYDPGEGLLYAEPGERVDGDLLVELQPGRSYMLICTLAAKGDTTHSMLGMLHPLHVRAK
jgi:hypothetical protein